MFVFSFSFSPSFGLQFTFIYFPAPTLPLLHLLPPIVLLLLLHAVLIILSYSLLVPLFLAARRSITKELAIVFCKLRLCVSVSQVWNEFHKGAATDGKSLTQDQLIASILKRRTDPKFTEALKQFMTLEFHEIDVNKDGFIQLDEYTIMFKFRGIDAAHAPASFAAIDTNNDGVISLDEFLWAIVDFFTGEDEKSPSRLFWGPLV